MRRDSILVILLFTALCLEAGAQTSQPASGDHGTTAQKTITEPTAKERTFRPKLSLQDALKIAEGFIGKEHIDIAPYWLYRAMYIVSGDEHTAPKDKIPRLAFLVGR